MPALLVPFVAGALTTAAGAIGLGGLATATILGATVATWAAYAVVTAVALGGYYLLSKMAAKPKTAGQQQTIKQAIPPRRRTYGRDKVGGAYVFDGADAANVNHTVLVFGQGPWDGIEHIHLGDKVGGADMSAGTGMAPHQNFMKIETYLGSVDQAASPLMLAAFPALWSADHRGRGLCYCVQRSFGVKAKHLGTYFPQGISEVHVEGRALQLYDPRSSQTAWSETAALAIRDLLTSPDGMKIPAQHIDDAVFSAAADKHETPVARAGGGTEPAYTVSHTYDMTVPPRDVLAELLRACDGEFYLTPEGKIGLRGGEWTEPTEHIGPDDLVSPFYEYSTGAGVMSAFNRLKITFRDPANDYQPVELEPWNDTAAQAEAGIVNGDLSLPAVTQWRQARRLAKIHHAKQNPRLRLTVHVRYGAAIRLWGERTCTVTIPELNISNEPFWVAAGSLDFQNDTGQFTLTSLSAEAYAWSPETEEGAPPTVAPQTDTAPVPPATTGAALELARTETSSGTFQVQARATVAAPAQEWETIGEYRRLGDTEWLRMADDGDEAVISPPLDDGQTYEVHVAHAGLAGHDSASPGPWSAILTIVATADPTAPAAPQSASLAKSGTTATASWVAPNSANYAAMRVYRNTANDSGSAALIATVYGSPSSAGSYADAGLANGTYWYWLRPINASGTASAYAATAPASLVIP